MPVNVHGRTVSYRRLWSRRRVARLWSVSRWNLPFLLFYLFIYFNYYYYAGNVCMATTAKGSHTHTLRHTSVLTKPCTLRRITQRFPWARVCRGECIATGNLTHHSTRGSPALAASPQRPTLAAPDLLFVGVGGGGELELKGVRGKKASAASPSSYRCQASIKVTFQIVLVLRFAFRPERRWIIIAARRPRGLIESSLSDGISGSVCNNGVESLAALQRNASLKRQLIY